MRDDEEQLDEDEDEDNRTRQYTIERSGFACRVLEMGIIAYGAHTYEELKTIAPDRVYAFDMNVRMERLRRHVASLNDIPKMLAFEGLPITSPNGNLGRIAWIEVCIDLALARLTSVRDIALFLVVETFELDLKPHQVSFNKLQGLGLPEAVLDDVKALADVAIDLRGERNRRVHRGEMRKHGGADHVMIQSASVWEAMGMPPGNIDALPSAENHGETYSLSVRCRAIADELNVEFREVANEVMDATIRVIDSLSEHFEPRWKEKLSRSKLGLS
ncbi:MAG: hypothetical protein Q8P41_26920 [Pseudomonadota bacterium]|nr:hypothetical protein [Pseudomonadota bacterium]